MLGTVADGEGHVTTFAYDPFRRLSRINYPHPTGSGQDSFAMRAICSKRFTATARRSITSTTISGA